MHVCVWHNHTNTHISCELHCNVTTLLLLLWTKFSFKKKKKNSVVFFGALSHVDMWSRLSPKIILRNIHLCMTQPAQRKRYESSASSDCLLKKRGLSKFEAFCCCQLSHLLSKFFLAIVNSSEIITRAIVIWSRVDQTHSWLSFSWKNFAKTKQEKLKIWAQ